MAQFLDPAEMTQERLLRLRLAELKVASEPRGELGPESTEAIVASRRPGDLAHGAPTKIWILEPREDIPADDDPWEPWFNRCFGLIVEAPTEAGARRIAHENCVAADETILRDRGVYLDPAWTTCVELVATGEARLIMADYRLS